MKRRNFLKAMGAGVILAASGTALIPSVRRRAAQILGTAKYSLTNKADVFNLHQVIASDITRARTVMWQSRNDTSDALLEYRIKNSSDIKLIKAGNEKFTDDNVTSFIHTAELSGLKAQNNYEYRVGSDKKRSEWHVLSTEGSDNFKVLIYPDSQCSDYNVWRDTAQAGWKNNQDALFFINMGDLVDNGEDSSQWNAWFAAIDNMASAIPIAPLLGNHEAYNKAWKNRMPLAYLKYFSLPEIAQQKYQNQYYAFDCGQVHFTVINTQMEEMEAFQPDMLEDEMKWLEKDLSEAKKKWKVVLMHRDVLQYGFQSRPEPREEGFSDEGKTFTPLFDKHHVDVVLTAHLHTYRNRGHIRNFQRDEKGPLYIITGVAGDVRYPSLWKQHSLDVVVAAQPETDNYMTMSAEKNSLTFSSFLPNGSLIDKVSVQKI